MSDSHSPAPHGQPGHAPAEFDDGVNLVKVILIGVVSLAIFAVGILWAHSILRVRQADVWSKGPTSTPTEIGKSEIGIVDQVLFENDHRFAKWRAERQQYLNSYGWIDRAKGLVHIPILTAMEKVVEDAAMPEAAPRVPAPAGPVAPVKQARPTRSTKKTSEGGER